LLPRRHVALQWRELEHTSAVAPEQPPHASIAEPALSVEEEHGWLGESGAGKEEDGQEHCQARESPDSLTVTTAPPYNPESHSPSM
jgi:hypothetical protein